MKATFDSGLGEFVRDGKKVMLSENGHYALVGWLSEVAKRSPKLAKQFKAFANFEIELDGKISTNQEYFEP